LTTFSNHRHILSRLQDNHLIARFAYFS